MKMHVLRSQSLRSQSLLAGLAGCLALTTLVACGSGDSGGTKQDVVLRVYGAASLTEAFTELGKQFEKDHPGTKVEFNFGPSSGLVEQIGSGAPADVFASASPANMETAVTAGDAKDPKDFAKNSMEIAVPPDNPAKIADVADLAKPGVKVALCQPQVPCGKVAAEVFANAKVTVKPATEEVDVKSVLTKVSLGEVDAGMVYVTDVQAAAEKVQGVEIAADQNASTTYPIAALEGSKHQKEAAEFVDLVLSDDGVQVLEDAGFESP
jgi:molybdate transport system substrate-binding protein